MYISSLYSTSLEPRLPEGKMKNAELHKKEGTPETHNRNKVRDREERQEQQGWERQVYREPPHRAIQQDFYLRAFFIHLVILLTNAHNFQVASWKSTDTHVLKLPFKFPSVFPTVWVNSRENRRITLKEEKKNCFNLKGDGSTHQRPWWGPEPSL